MTFPQSIKISKDTNTLSNAAIHNKYILTLLQEPDSRDSSRYSYLPTPPNLIIGVAINSQVVKRCYLEKRSTTQTHTLKNCLYYLIVGGNFVEIMRVVNELLQLNDKAVAG